MAPLAIEWKEVIYISYLEISEYKRDGWELIGLAKPYGVTGYAVWMGR